MSEALLTVLTGGLYLLTGRSVTLAGLWLPTGRVVVPVSNEIDSDELAEYLAQLRRA